MTQRFAIGGLVASFAVQARAVHGLSDAHVGLCFSLVLVVFALGVFILGRRYSGPRLTTWLPFGAIVSGAAFVALALVQGQLVLLALGAAGLGCALVYAPCLSVVAATSPDGRRATSMALLHSAGAVGMILGPLVAAVIDMTLQGLSVATRAAVFMTSAGTLHALVAFVLAPRCRALAAAHPTQPGLFEDSNDCTLTTAATRAATPLGADAPR
jgi:MFS family permease